jgi:uncharacterized membrane protein YfcA
MDFDTLLIYCAVGFVAQLVDGALGMAYGVTASSMLLSVGVPPVLASATVHVAEVCTTGASAVSHRYFGNIDKTIFGRLLVPAVLGAVAGAYLLSSFPTELVKPIVSAYLLVMGAVIVVKAFMTFPPKAITSRIQALGFCGGFLDAAGGGGWGPIVASTLIAKGNELRVTVGSVCAVEFFVAFAASATFLLQIGDIPWELVFGLAGGGLLAAPCGAWVCSRLPPKPFMVLVGAVITGLSFNSLWQAF